MTVAGLTAAESLERCRDLVRPALRTAVDDLHPWTARMAAYTFGWADAEGNPLDGEAGKGVRQAFAILAAEALGAQTESAVQGAVAVELVHAFSLVHDDIMDGDERRRHRATAWRAYGVGPAVLLGDALLALSVEVLARTGADRTGAATRLLSAALIALANGQAADLEFETRPWTGPHAVTVSEYLCMAQRKTGSLLGCAAGLGALLGGAPADAVAAVTRVGADLGIAFQAIDDLLGIWGDPALTGKPVHGDLTRRKKTLPVVAAAAFDPVLGERIGDLIEAGDTAGAARAIDQAGGRSFTASQAGDHLRGAVAELDRICVNRSATAEFTALAAFIADRSF
jgi:geranylgeranyl diphosphate synthase, type I